MAKKATSDTTNSKPDGPQAEASEAKATSQIERLFEQGKLKESLDRFSSFLDCFEEIDFELARVKSRLSGLETDEKAQRIGPEALIMRNQISFDYQKTLADFRKNVLGQYFDLRGEADFLNSINDRDQVMHKILDLRLLAKHYQRDEAWGKVEGNSSIIYRLFNPGMRRHAIAMMIKMPHIDEHAKQEIEMLTDLRHRNVIKLLDSEIDRFPFFVITEFVYGDNLPNALRIVGPRSVSQTIDWLYQLTDALDYLRHKRILHTNVRPSKIYIDDEWQIMISPFDLIKITATRNQGNRISKSEYPGERTFNRYLDVCQYGSPELFRADGETLDLDAMCLSDLYSIGLIGYKILTGEDLFSGKKLYDIIENRKKLEFDEKALAAKLAVLPAHPISDIIRQLLQPDLEERKKAFPNLHALLRKLTPLTRSFNEDVSPVRQSYRRCLANNREFVRDFYQAFYRVQLPNGKTYGDFFSDTARRRQSSMLQMAIDLLLDLDQRSEHFVELVHPKNAKHGGFSPHDYERFLDTLIDTIRLNDQLHWNDGLEQGWREVREKAMKLIGDLHGGRG
jgi:serine/threonine protein kinase